MGDFRTTTGQPPPITRRDQVHRRRRRIGIALGSAIILFLIGFVIRMNREIAAAGYVTSEHYAEVRPAVVAAVSQILVRSGQRVNAGDLMVQFDNAEEQATLEEARSQLRKVEAELARREADIEERKRQYQQDIAVARLHLEHADARLERTRELSAKGLAPGKSVEDDLLNKKVSEAELDALLGRDESLPFKELAVLKQEVESRRDAVGRAEARLRSRQVRAPISGRVVRYEFVVGELVKPDLVLYEIFGGDERILKLRIPERFATLVEPGDTYRAELVPYRRRGVEFSGQVLRLRDVIQAEDRTTYRTATCTFEDNGYSVPPGTSAEARIHIGRSSLWATLFGIY